MWHKKTDRKIFYKNRGTTDYNWMLCAKMCKWHRVFEKRVLEYFLRNYVVGAGNARLEKQRKYCRTCKPRKWYYTASRKRANLFFASCLSSINSFQQNLVGLSWKKHFTKLCMKCPLHQLYVLALPWENMMRQFEQERSTYMYILINNWITANTNGVQTCSKSRHIYSICSKCPSPMHSKISDVDKSKRRIRMSGQNWITLSMRYASCCRQLACPLFPLVMNFCVICMNTALISRTDHISNIPV